jgi:DNA-binding transcriptional ArsR family regulator
MYSQLQWRHLPVHFQALASPTRLHMLERLAERGEMSVKDLATSLRMSQPRVSWHLAMLRRGGAVRTRREGRQVRCSLDLEAIRRHQLAFWELVNEERAIGGRP